MAQIIVTVVDRATGISYDMEVPNDLDADKLLDDVTQALIGADPSFDWDMGQIRWYSPKLGRYLKSKATLLEEGIWNGDYLYISE